MNFVKKQAQSLHSFFTKPHSPVPLGIFRILLASFAIIQAFFWYRDWQAFFGPDAWIQWEISQAHLTTPGIHISQVCKFFSWFGLNNEQSVNLFFWIYTGSAALLLLGLYTRVWAILVWFCHYIIMISIDIYSYGVDIFLHIALFYMMFMPVAKSFSLDARLKRVNPDPTWGVTLSLRVLQIHLCLSYLSAGYEKAFSMDWWNGNVVWRSIVQPDFRQYDLTWMANSPWIPKLLGWFTIVTETGYCFAMWIPRLRVFWLAAIIMLHLGIGIFLGLWSFALIMILLSISAFGYDAYGDIQRWRKKRKQKSTSPDQLANDISR